MLGYQRTPMYGCNGPLPSDQPLSGTASDYSYSTGECVSTLISKGSDQKERYRPRSRQAIGRLHSPCTEASLAHCELQRLRTQVANES
jgi:hypothetical protein